MDGVVFMDGISSGFHFTELLLAAHGVRFRVQGGGHVVPCSLSLHVTVLRE